MGERGLRAGHKLCEEEIVWVGLRRGGGGGVRSSEIHKDWERQVE